MKNFFTFLACVCLVFVSQIDLNGQSICGLDGGTIEAPGSVNAGSISHPSDGTILELDGSNSSMFTQSGSTADNGGIYPQDAVLPNPVTLEFTNPQPATIESSQDYNYVIEIPDGNGGSVLIASTDGTFNPADPVGDGSVSMSEGDVAKVAGFAFSLDQLNYILKEVAQSPFVCPTFLEPSLPEGVTCEDIYAIPSFTAVTDAFDLASNLFDLTITDAPSAVGALVAIETVLAGVNVASTPCYAATKWNDPAVSGVSITDQLGDDASFEEEVAALEAAWGGYSYSLCTDADCTGGSVSIIDLNKIAFDVYPSPATDVIKVKYDRYTDNSFVDVKDISGKVVKKAPTNANGTTEINISDLDAGSYVVSFFLDGQVVSKKIMKN